MELAGFDWDSGNREKCREHDMALAEIESVFRSAVVILPDKENPRNERRFRAIGTTSEGRKAFIVFTWRSPEGGRLVRPISARYMHAKEIRTYEKNYPDVP